MARSIAIVGKSGTGKSTSFGQIPELNIKGLNPKTTALFNIAGKSLPMRGWKSKYTGKISENGNYIETSNYDTIIKALNIIDEKREDITDIVIDDGQYIMAFEFMNRAGESGYKKFADIGTHLNQVIQTVKNMKRDVNVYYLWHPEVDGEGSLKLKTVGKMVDDYITLEGLFTVVLYTKVSKEDNKIKYSFVTNNDGQYPAKSPVGMFKDLYIPNDLGLVKETIEKYDLG